jgi:flagellar basal body rod protein FlgB
MKITIKKDNNTIIIDEQRSDDTTIRYNFDRIIQVIEAAIQSMTKDRKEK